MNSQHPHQSTPRGVPVQREESKSGPDPLPLKSSGYGSGVPEARSLGGSDGPGASEDVLARTIDAFMLSMSNAFDGVFARPDIARTMLAFMQGDVVFVVTNTELQVRRREEVDPPPMPGLYL